MWQMKTKRGIMVQFLVTIILALIIFVPACYVSSKILFRTSEQAKDNYVEFVKQLTEFAEKAKFGEQKSILLIMDTATAAVYFEKGNREVVVNVDSQLRLDYAIHLQKPGQCDDNKNCLCLFRKSDFEAGLDTVTVIPKQVICTNLDYNLEVETCSIGKPEEVNSYICSHGFMIERHLADKSSWRAASYYELPRRTVLYFTKFENSVRLIGNYGGENEREK